VAGVLFSAASGIQERRCVWHVVDVVIDAVDAGAKHSWT
jgi:hypothetical protein